MSPLSLFFFFFLPSVSSSSLFPLLLVICPVLPPNIAHLHVLWRPFCCTPLPCRMRRRVRGCEQRREGSPWSDRQFDTNLDLDEAV
jgi:hypothetical protein